MRRFHTRLERLKSFNKFKKRVVEGRSAHRASGTITMAILDLYIMSDENNNKGVNEGLPPLNDTAIQTLFIISFLLLLLLEYIIIIVYQHVRTYQQYRSNELYNNVQCDQVDYLIQLINEQERLLSLLKRNSSRSSSIEEQLHSNNNNDNNNNDKGVTMENKKLMDRYRILQNQFMDKKQRFVLSS
jgi:hypothetical protein